MPTTETTNRLNAKALLITPHSKETGVTVHPDAVSVEAEVEEAELEAVVLCTVNQADEEEAEEEEVACVDIMMTSMLCRESAPEIN